MSCLGVFRLQDDLQTYPESAQGRNPTPDIKVTTICHQSMVGRCGIFLCGCLGVGTQSLLGIVNSESKVLMMINEKGSGVLSVPQVVNIR